MDTARDAALGEAELRSKQKPVLSDDGTYHGGTAYERSDRAIPVKPGTRAYTNANTYQRAATIAGPVASGKMRGDALDDNQQIRQDINFVSWSWW